MRPITMDEVIEQARLVKTHRTYEVVPPPTDQEIEEANKRLNRFRAATLRRVSRDCVEVSVTVN